MTFRTIDEREAVLACEWARYDGDCGRLHWSSESSWKEREERDEDRGLHGGNEDAV